MTDDATASPPLPARLFTRQPVFDSRQRTWGYALAFGPASPTQDGEAAPPGTPPDIAAEVLSLTGSLFGQDRKVIVDFGERPFLDEAPYALPPDRTVIEIHGCAALPPSAAEALDDFRANGLAIALPVEEAVDAPSQIQAIGDILTISLTGRTREELQALLDRIPRRGALLLARDVDDAASLTIARALGADLFQGAFYHAKDLLRSRKPTSHEVSRFKLLAAIERNDPDFDRLTEVIQNDATISYRLLYYLNSPAFGFSDRITSIRQALVLLGWKLLKNWLRVVILTDINPDRQSRQLLLQSVQRGKFFELTANSQTPLRDDPDMVFLLGMLSLLEPLLLMPMEEVVGHLPLTDELTNALTGKAENRCANWLRLAQAYERADWEGLDEIIDRLGLHPLTVSVAYYKSILWAESVFSAP